jgi:hypothetical protein
MLVKIISGDGSIISYSKKYFTIFIKSVWYTVNRYAVKFEIIKRYSFLNGDYCKFKSWNSHFFI